ncbi:MAG: hypothetical protein ACE5FI_18665, partial [Anaerolineales bacterium]
MNDEKDAAAAFAGRLIPQTAGIKAATALLGITGKGKVLQPGGLELDPLILAQGGLGTYEKRRVGRMLALLVDQGLVGREEAIDAAYTQSGEAWDLAQEYVQTGLPGAGVQTGRAVGQVGSTLFGVGFKGRNARDIAIDQFYGDMFGLIQRKPDLSPQEYRAAWDDLGKRYPFMDTLLLARKNPEYRDESYVWTVMRRIPPGQSRDLLESVGLDEKLIDRWYSGKGFDDTWRETDRQRMLAGAVDLGALLALPNEATQAEWNAARADHRVMRAQIKKRFGDDIYDLIDVFFGLGDGTPEGYERRDAFLELYPVVGEALDFQTEYVIGHPRLTAYYGGIDEFERFYTSQWRSEMEKQYGEDIWIQQDAYFRLKENGGAYRVYLTDHPQLREMWDAKDEFETELDARLARLNVPEPDGPFFRDSQGNERAMKPGANDALAGLYEGFVSNGATPNQIALSALMAPYEEGTPEFVDRTRAIGEETFPTQAQFKERIHQRAIDKFGAGIWDKWNAYETAYLNNPDRALEMWNSDPDLAALDEWKDAEWQRYNDAKKGVEDVPASRRPGVSSAGGGSASGGSSSSGGGFPSWKRYQREVLLPEARTRIVRWSPSLVTV